MNERNLIALLKCFKCINMGHYAHIHLDKDIAVRGAHVSCTIIHLLRSEDILLANQSLLVKNIVNE